MEQTEIAREQGAPAASILAEQAWEGKVRKVFSWIVSVYLCVVFGAFPLYFHNYYYDILVSKYQFYWLSTVAMLASCLIAAIVFACMDLKQFDGAHVRRFFGAFRPSELKKQPFAYKALEVFWGLALISTVLSDYVYESFWGNEGRFSGLFLITLYVLGTIVISKYGRMRKWYLDVFLASSVLVCLFGITDYFQMDLLGWKKGVSNEQGNVFVSTLGNINTYTAFVALTMAVACGCFVSERKVGRRIWYYLVSVLAFFALITGQSDNAYLSLGMLFAVMPLFLFTTWRGIADYGILAATFMTVIKVVDTVNKVYADQVIGLGGVFGVLVRYRYLEGVVVLFWILAGVLCVWKRKMEQTNPESKPGRWIWRGWCAVLILGCLAVAFVLYDANLGGHAERYSALSQYLVFDDDWGTNRGYCWRIGWQSYRELPFLHQLFGFGPDTYGILTWDFRQDALDRYGVFYESAHNEYFQYLVTMAPACRCAKNGKSAPGSWRLFWRCSAMEHRQLLISTSRSRHRLCGRCWRLGLHSQERKQNRQNSSNRQNGLNRQQIRADSAEKPNLPGFCRFRIKSNV